MFPTSISGIIIFFLVFIILYSILSKAELIKNPVLNALISLIVAFLIASAPNFVLGLSISLPWLAALMVVFFFIVVAIKFFTGNDISINMKGINMKGLGVAFVIIVGIIFISSLIYMDYRVRTQKAAHLSSSDYTTVNDTKRPSTWQEEFVKTFFHPYVLGLFLIFVIAAIAIFFLAK